MKAVAAAIVVFCFISCAKPTVQPPSPAAEKTRVFWSSHMSDGCHKAVVDQFEESHHARAFSNPVFQAQYFKEVLVRAGQDPLLQGEAAACIACHSPADHLRVKGHLTSPQEADPRLSGVICDFCHTITGFSGEAAGNANYIIDPGGERKLGPFRHEYNWHHVYSELQTKSELCGICHNAVNHHGLEIKATLTEWKESVYAKLGIQCQDCHMSLFGFLVDWKSVHESGYAARMHPPFEPYRSKLYSHRFPGAHSRTQIMGGGQITLSLETERATVSPGEEVIITVFVNNEKTGHKMPTGSADLRHLWLALEAQSNGKVIPIPALPQSEARGYDIAGGSPFDRDVLGNEVPDGARVYRLIFADSAGRETLSSYDAVRTVFDNRLNATEMRAEKYLFRVPREIQGNIVVRATLNYLPYPDVFSDRFGLPRPESFEMASARKVIGVVKK